MYCYWNHCCGRLSFINRKILSFLPFFSTAVYLIPYSRDVTIVLLIGNNAKNGRQSKKKIKMSFRRNKEECKSWLQMLLDRELIKKTFLLYSPCIEFFFKTHCSVACLPIISRVTFLKYIKTKAFVDIQH